MLDKINPHSIISAFIKLYKDKNVRQIFDYDERHYILEAVQKNGNIDYNGSFYSYDKTTGEIAAFTPVYDLQRFFTAMNKYKIWKKDEVV